MNHFYLGLFQNHFSGLSPNLCYIKRGLYMEIFAFWDNSYNRENQTENSWKTIVRGLSFVTFSSSRSRVALWDTWTQRHCVWLIILSLVMHDLFFFSLILPEKHEWPNRGKRHHIWTLSLALSLVLCTRLPDLQTFEHKKEIKWKDIFLQLTQICTFLSMDNKGSKLPPDQHVILI